MKDIRFPFQAISVVTTHGEGIAPAAGFRRYDGMSKRPSPSIDSLTARLIAFRDARDWRQFHSLKNLIASLNLEAAEVLELTQWKTDDQFEVDAVTSPTQTRLAEECADVLLYLLLISERAGFDLAEAAAAKITANELKYPVEKARGNAKKYTEL